MVEAAPLGFSDPDGLRRSMQRAGVLYNTYWVRYAYGRTPSISRSRTLRTHFWPGYIQMRRKQTPGTMYP